MEMIYDLLTFSFENILFLDIYGLKFLVQLCLF